VIGRIPILDVQPVVRVATELGANAPAKAVPDERFMVSATVFREGHEMLGAGVVLTDPAGQHQPIAAMHELAEGMDRYGAEVAAKTAIMRIVGPARATVRASGTRASRPASACSRSGSGA